MKPILVILINLFFFVNVNGQIAYVETPVERIESEPKSNLKARLKSCAIEEGTGISICSKRAIIEKLESKLTYSESAVENWLEFKAKVQFKVSTAGEVSEIMIEAGKNTSLYETALISTLKRSKWVPSYKDGVAVESEMTFNLVYKLDK